MGEVLQEFFTHFLGFFVLAHLAVGDHQGVHGGFAVGALWIAEQQFVVGGDGLPFLTGVIIGFAQAQEDGGQGVGFLIEVIPTFTDFVEEDFEAGGIAEGFGGAVWGSGLSLASAGGD